MKKIILKLILNKLEKLITKNTSLIIINNPNNPTGSFMNKEKIDEIVKMLENYPRYFHNV